MTILNLTSGNSFNSGNANFNTVAITPSAKKVYYCWVESFLNSGSVNLPTLSGAGLTWTQVGTVLQGTNLRLTLFRAEGTGGSNGALTINHGGQTQIGCSWSIDEVTGCKTTGTNGSDSVVAGNFGSQGDNSSTTGILVTLPAFAKVSNFAYGCVLNQGGAAVSVGSGFTQLVNIGVGIQTLVTEYQKNDNTVDFSWGSSSSQHLAGAIEIAAAPTSGGFFEVL